MERKIYHSTRIRSPFVLDAASSIVKTWMDYTLHAIARRNRDIPDFPDGAQVSGLFDVPNPSNSFSNVGACKFLTSVKVLLR